MHHGRLHEGERKFSEIQFVPRTNLLERKVAVVQRKRFLSGACDGVDFRIGRKFRDFPNRTRMVGLRVVGDDKVNLGRIYNRPNPREHLLRKTGLYGVDECNLVAHEEIGVVGTPSFRAVPVKIADAPVRRAHPIDPFSQLSCFEHNWNLVSYHFSGNSLPYPAGKCNSFAESPRCRGAICVPSAYFDRKRKTPLPKSGRGFLQRKIVYSNTSGVRRIVLISTEGYSQ